jgi:predicted dehydrogenase
MPGSAHSDAAHGERDLRIAVVGLGQRSTLAMHVHRPGLGARVVAVCDVNEDRLADARTRFGADVHFVRDHHELLPAQLDAALILTPDHTHEQIGIDLLEAGIAALVEKPLAITVEGCDRLLDAARRTRARLYVGHNMRHMPVIRAMHDLIRDGAIGAVKAIWCRHFVGHGGDFYFKDWHANRGKTTSLLLQKGAHDLDVIHWLAGSYTVRTNALGGLAVYGTIDDRRDRSSELLSDWFDPDRNWPPSAHTGLHPTIDVEDISMVNLVLANGVLASYQQCHFTPDYWRNYTVIGTHGRLENFGDTNGAVVKVWNRRRSDYRRDADLTVEVPAGDGGHGGADPALMSEFLQFVRHGGPTLTSPVAARQAVATGYAATHSLRAGGIPMGIPPLPPELEAYFATGQDPTSRPGDAPGQR